MATELTELRIDGGQLHFRGRCAPLHATTFKALTLLLAGGRVPIESLSALVWGNAEMTREAVYSLAFRCNKVLDALGTAARVTVGRGSIGLTIVAGAGRTDHGPDESTARGAGCAYAILAQNQAVENGIGAEHC